MGFQGYRWESSGSHLYYAGSSASPATNDVPARALLQLLPRERPQSQGPSSVRANKTHRIQPAAHCQWHGWAENEKHVNKYKLRTGFQCATVALYITITLERVRQKCHRHRHSLALAVTSLIGAEAY